MILVVTLTPTQARALRTALAEVLDPLYAGRRDDLPPQEAIARAIARLYALDERLRTVTHGAGNDGPGDRE